MPLLLTYDIRYSSDDPQKYFATRDRITEELKKLGAKKLLDTVWTLSSTDVLGTTNQLAALLRRDDQLVVTPINSEPKVVNGTRFDFSIGARPLVRPR